MDIITYSLCNKKAKQYTDEVISNLPRGIIYKGSVNYYSNLPNNAEIGDCYTVMYKGTSGSVDYGVEYVWGLNTATSTNEWVKIGEQYDEATTAEAGLMSASDKTKLNSIATNAQVNTIETIKVNNASQTITNKTVNIDCEVPSNKVTSIDSNSTDTQYPSAKCVYTLVGNIQSALEVI